MKSKLLGIFTVMALMAYGCDKGTSDQIRDDDGIAKAVMPTTQPQKQDGIALAVVVDCSGSMADSVNDGIKSVIAKQCVRNIVQKAEIFSKTSKEKVNLAIYRFNDSPSMVFPLGPPSLANSESSIQELNPSGGTAIGEAILAATHDMNMNGYSSVHILVVTDGDNTNGTEPNAVATAFAKLPPQYRPNVYIVAFDTSAEKFKPLRDNGWKILSASSGSELTATINQLVGGEILLEK